MVNLNGLKGEKITLVTLRHILKELIENKDYKVRATNESMHKQWIEIPTFNETFFCWITNEELLEGDPVYIIDKKIEEKFIKVTEVNEFIKQSRLNYLNNSVKNYIENKSDLMLMTIIKDKDNNIYEEIMIIKNKDISHKLSYINEVYDSSLSHKFSPVSIIGFGPTNIHNII